jgi:hypothetical protein
VRAVANAAGFRKIQKYLFSNPWYFDKVLYFNNLHNVTVTNVTNKTIHDHLVTRYFLSKAKKSKKKVITMKDNKKKVLAFFETICDHDPHYTSLVHPTDKFVQVAVEIVVFKSSGEIITLH